MTNFRGFRAADENNVPTLYIYDDIGPAVWGMIDAETVIGELEAFGNVDEINLRINSQGGDVFEAFAIYNALLRHEAQVIVDVDALAASAASLIAMAGNRIRMAENAMLMIHDPWTFAIGNSDELGKVIEVLDKITQTIVDTYVARAGNKSDAETIRQQMRDETWLTAQESIDAGLADEIGQAMQVAAHVTPELYARCPLKPTATSPKPAGQFQRPAASMRPYRSDNGGTANKSTDLATVKLRLETRLAVLYKPKRCKRLDCAEY